MAILRNIPTKSAVAITKSLPISITSTAQKTSMTYGPDERAAGTGYKRHSANSCPLHTYDKYERLYQQTDPYKKLIYLYDYLNRAGMLTTANPDGTEDASKSVSYDDRL